MPVAQSAALEAPPASRSSTATSPHPVDSMDALALHLSRQLNQCRRVGGQMAMLWIEVEPLTAHGAASDWAMGPELMRAAGQRLRNRVRGTDEVLQVGELGFAVLLKAAATGEAAIVALRLQHALIGAYGVERGMTYLGVRMGTAVFPDAGRHGGELVKAAVRDLALRQGA